MPPTPTATPKGSRIRELRVSRRWSVLALAQRACRHESTIRQVEASKPASLIVLGQVADALEVPIEEICLLPASKSAVECERKAS